MGCGNVPADRGGAGRDAFFDVRFRLVRITYRGRKCFQFLQEAIKSIRPKATGIAVDQLTNFSRVDPDHFLPFLGQENFGPALIGRIVLFQHVLARTELSQNSGNARQMKIAVFGEARRV